MLLYFASHLAQGLLLCAQDKDFCKLCIFFSLKHVKFMLHHKCHVLFGINPSTFKSQLSLEVIKQLLLAFYYDKKVLSNILWQCLYIYKYILFLILLMQQNFFFPL